MAKASEINTGGISGQFLWGYEETGLKNSAEAEEAMLPRAWIVARKCWLPKEMSVEVQRPPGDNYSSEVLLSLEASEALGHPYTQ